MEYGGFNEYVGLIFLSGERTRSIGGSLRWENRGKIRLTSELDA